MLAKKSFPRRVKPIYSKLARSPNGGSSALLAANKLNESRFRSFLALQPLVFF